MRGWVGAATTALRLGSLGALTQGRPRSSANPGLGDATPLALRRLRGGYSHFAVPSCDLFGFVRPPPFRFRRRGGNGAGETMVSVPARKPAPSAGLKTSPFQACRLLARVAALAPPRRLGRVRRYGSERALRRWKKEERLAPLFEEDAAAALSFAGFQAGRFRGIPARH
jgi:hypothetical protein